MEQNSSDIIEFDILLKPAGSSKTPDLVNIEQFQPSPADIEKCRRWFISKGVTSYATDFGLACSAPAKLFEELFQTKVKQSAPAPGTPAWQCSPEPKAPSEIKNYIDQISISVPPELF
ncbi:MAG: protease pro-enzyme activation domain-containing protein [Planctomycetota bacterium]|jgi:hypothetical protein